MPNFAKLPADTIPPALLNADHTIGNGNTATGVGDQRASELFSAELLEHVSGVREPSKQAEPENGQPLLVARSKQPTAVDDGRGAAGSCVPPAGSLPTGAGSQTVPGYPPRMPKPMKFSFG